MAWRYEKLPCIFCKCPLNKVDAHYFHEGDYRCVKRENQWHAVCRPCILAVCKLERDLWEDLLRYSGDDVERISGRRLEDINVRCKICGGGVTDSEKQYNKLTKKPFYFYRRRWRTRCYDCKRAGNAGQ
ncbi:E6 [Equus caballus papillomavirus 5]|uniref:Protein E6 n=1 Tax=Equus caballus papillomavirus 5 TaxID=1235429 RepID=K9M9L6_9PAPI|nr:E6 [Equus caballus papillomavirus 5]AFS89114.1 E6 [Equus caballus papillomavirus 5]